MAPQPLASCVCLLLSSLLVGGMGLLWLAVFLLGLLIGAGLGGAAVASPWLGVDLPVEMLYTGGGLLAAVMGVVTVLSIVNLCIGGIGLFAALRSYRSGRVGWLRFAAWLQIVTAVVFGLPGLVTMNPLAILWGLVLGLGVAGLVLLPTPERA